MPGAKRSSSPSGSNAIRSKPFVIIDLTSSLIPYQTYSMKVIHSYHFLDVASEGSADGTPIIQYQLHGKPNQQFRLEPVGEDDWYYVRCVHSNKVWDVVGASMDDHAGLCQYEFHGGVNQQFRFEEAAGKEHHIIARHSGKYIGVKKTSHPVAAKETLGYQAMQLSEREARYPTRFFFMI